MNNRAPKVRKRDFASDVHDVFENGVNFDQLEPNKVVRIKFSNKEGDLVLNRKVTHVLSPGNISLNAVATNLLMSSDYWHSITIHHQGAFVKEEIQRGLDEIVNNISFIPVAYRSGKTEDTFYVRNQSAALHNMIKNNMQTFLTNRRLSFTLKLAVACYEVGQLDPIEKLDSAIADVLCKFREERLDFCHFSKHKLFTDIIFTMRNKGNFELFCDRLLRVLCTETTTNRNLVNNLKILVLAGNGIRNLDPLRRFIRCKYIQNISLRNNAIDTVKEFEALAPLKLKILSVYGNPVVPKDDYQHIADQILAILSSLEKLDIKKIRMAEVQPQQQSETVITPNVQTEEVVRSKDITPAYKLDFPRKEYIKTFWSEVVIEHQGNYEGKQVLNEMFRVFFEDMTFYPCYYQVGQYEDSFKLHNNFGPLNTLVQNDLRMIMPDTNDFVTFRLHLKTSPVKTSDIKWHEVLNKVIEKRIVGQKLDLKNLRNDHDLRDIVVNMTSMEVKRYVIYAAINKNLKIMEIDLSHNEIHSLKGFDFKNFSELISLDFSNNNIQNLRFFPENLKIVELSLAKNPVCDKFKTDLRTPYDYVQKLMSLCPTLQYIDGRKIDQSFRLVHLHNYFPISTAYPAVESFIDYFFKHFDNLQARSNVLCNIYKNESILTVVDDKKNRAIKFGHDEIKQFYGCFPFTEHDYTTMTVDTPIFNNQNILIVVNGVFKLNLYSTNEDEKLLTFSRTFMLRREKRFNNVNRCRTNGTLSETYNYDIQNEIFSFQTLNDHRIKNKAFKRQRAADYDIERAYEDKFSVKNEFTANVELFRQTTLLNEDWCARILEDANGDYLVALTNFLNFYKNNTFKKEDFNIPAK